MAGHRNCFEENIIVDNGNTDEGYGIRIMGETSDLEFSNNVIGNEKTRNQRVGIQIGENAGTVKLTNKS